MRTGLQKLVEWYFNVGSALSPAIVHSKMKEMLAEEQSCVKDNPEPLTQAKKPSPSLIAELREWLVECDEWVGLPDKDKSSFLGILRRHSTPAPVDKGLVEIKGLLRKAYERLPIMSEDEIDELNSILDDIKMYSRHQPAEVEPLAVLADRKGIAIIEILPPIDKVNTWDIEIMSAISDGVQREKVFEGETYSAAEQSARAFLSSLPDAKGGSK